MEIAICANLKNNEIFTVPIGQTISGETKDFITIAVVPKNKVDMAVGVILGQFALIGFLKKEGIEFSTEHLYDFGKSSIDYIINKKIPNFKNTDL